MNIKNSFSELLSTLELIIIPILLGFVDVINYYPNGDSPAFYGDGSEPFYISFSLFNCLIAFFVILIKQEVHEIYLYGVPLYSEPDDDEAN